MPKVQSPHSSSPTRSSSDRDPLSGECTLGFFADRDPELEGMNKTAARKYNNKRIRAFVERHALANKPTGRAEICLGGSNLLTMGSWVQVCTAGCGHKVHVLSPPFTIDFILDNERITPFLLIQHELEPTATKTTASASTLKSRRDCETRAKLLNPVRERVQQGYQFPNRPASFMTPFQVRACKGVVGPSVPLVHPAALLAQTPGTTPSTSPTKNVTPFTTPVRALARSSSATSLPLYAVLYCWTQDGHPHSEVILRPTDLPSFRLADHKLALGTIGVESGTRVEIYKPTTGKWTLTPWAARTHIQESGQIFFLRNKGVEHMFMFDELLEASK